MKALLIIDALEALLNLAVSVGINFTKLAQMREANGGELSAEQRQELADDAQSAIDQL